MIAYIQKHRGEFANINTLTAFLGFQEKGYEVHCFEFPELSGLSLNFDSLVVGGVRTVIAAFQQMGITPPELPSIPPVLESFAGRRTWLGTMAEAEAEIHAGRMIFVKPVAADRKLFPGTPFRVFRDTIPTAHIPQDHPVVLSEIVDFISEYRVFVLDGEIIGLRHYKGDFRIFPDLGIIDSAIAAYHSAPAAYAIDFGITKEGRTLLVETNEAFSLGCYGLTPLLYSTLLERRWEELKSKHWQPPVTAGSHS